MELPNRMRIGGVVVELLQSGRFMFRDANDATQVQVVEDFDIPELLEFLYARSSSAQRALEPVQRREKPTDQPTPGRTLNELA